MLRKIICWNISKWEYYGESKKIVHMVKHGNKVLLRKIMCWNISTCRIPSLYAILYLLRYFFRFKTELVSGRWTSVSVDPKFIKIKMIVVMVKKFKKWLIYNTVKHGEEILLHYIARWYISTWNILRCVVEKTQPQKMWRWMSTTEKVTMNFDNYFFDVDEYFISGLLFD